MAKSRGFFRNRESGEENSKVDPDLGFGLNNYQGATRFLNTDGSPNVLRIGIPIWDRIDPLHLMLNLSWMTFFLSILVGYVIVNFLFAGLYFLIGVEHLSGIVGETASEKFWEAFFFSAQTITTVGYGRISPMGHWASWIAAFESLLGLLGFAVFTGLIYGRFARPSNQLMFTPNAVIAPYKGISALMFRVANPKINELTEIDASIMLIMFDHQSQKRTYQALKLERNSIMFLAMNWTIVHPLDEDSPLVDMDKKDFEHHQVELVVTLKAFDETRAQNIFCRSSYKFSDIKWGEKFVPIKINFNNAGTMMYDLGTLNGTIPADLPQASTKNPANV